MKNINDTNIKIPIIICLNDEFNEKLVQSGKAKTLVEAAKIPTFLYCPCPKCGGNVSFSA